MSRPSKGVEHVDSLEGDETTKARLKAVLETISNETTVEEACRRLSLSPARFHELREEALRGALAALSPRAPGRPPAPALDPEVKALRQENADLRRDLEAAHIRTEIALVMPHVIQPLKGVEKKGPAPKNDARSGT